MSFTRKFLSALGIEPDKIDEIMNAHIEVTDGLKSDIANLKAENETLKMKADELTEVQEQLEQAQKAAAYEAKYKDLKTEFDNYKTEQEKQATRQAKETAYKKALHGAGISEKYLAVLMKASSAEMFTMAYSVRNMLLNPLLGTRL